MKFTLRDLVWLVLVVALGLGWALDRSQLAYGYRLCLSRAAQVTDYLERVEDPDGGMAGRGNDYSPAVTSKLIA